MQYASQAISESMQVISLASLADNVLLSASLNGLLSIMKNLQLVLNEALLKTAMPADAGEFCTITSKSPFSR